jgi:hypothetical protein
MNPPYQLPASLGDVATRLNPEIANYQKAEDVLMDDKKAFGQNYTEMCASFYGDPRAGTMIPGTNIPYNSLTQVQRDLYDEWNLGAGPTSPSDLPDNFADLLAQNPGPTGPGNWWNSSYNDLGLDPTQAADSSIKTVTIYTDNKNGTVSTTTGVTV